MITAEKSCLVRFTLAIFCVVCARLAAGVPVAATQSISGSTADETTLLDALAEDGRFEMLAVVLHQAGLANDLADSGPFTLFAPTDYAFDSLPENELDQLLADPDALQTRLLHHMLPAKATAYELAQMGSAATGLGTSLTFIQHGDELMVDGAIVERAQIEASNGVIYVINRVLELPADHAMAATEAVTTTPVVTATQEQQSTASRAVTQAAAAPDAADEASVTGGSLLRGATQAPVFVLLLVLLAGGAFFFFRRLG